MPAVGVGPLIKDRWKWGFTGSNGTKGDTHELVVFSTEPSGRVRVSSACSLADRASATEPEPSAQARARHFQGDLRRSLGFDGADANLYRYAYNRPTYATDPTGLDISTTPEADAYYFDEWVKSVPAFAARAEKQLTDLQKQIDMAQEMYDKLARTDPNLAKSLILPQLNRVKAQQAEQVRMLNLFKATLEPSKKFVENLKKLSQIPNLTVAVYYVNERPDVLAFARDVAAKGGNSVNLYFGHGIGSLVSGQGAVNREVVTKVEEALRNLPSTGANRPRVGFYSCFGGLYNNVAPEPNRIAAPFDAETAVTIDKLAGFFNDHFGETETMIKRLLRENGNNLTLRIYFGKFEPRTTAIKESDPDRNGLFAKW
jgi:hypothetical protein